MVRTIRVKHGQPADLMRLLHDMRSMVRHLVSWGLDHSCSNARVMRDANRPWFQKSWRHRYAAHYLHSACSVAAGILRSHSALVRVARDSGSRLPGRPIFNRLMARLDQELFRVRGGLLDVTVRPGFHLQFSLVDLPKHRHAAAYSRGKMGELTVTPLFLFITFQYEVQGTVGSDAVGIDTNMTSVDWARTDGVVGSVDLSEIPRIQGAYRRRSNSIDRQLPSNRMKQQKLKRSSAHREQNRVRDRLVKAAKAVADRVVFDPVTRRYRSLVFEDLSQANRDLIGHSTNHNWRISRWPHGAFQRYVAERVPPDSVIWVNPRGTSSRCPGCGSPVDHSGGWRTSHCAACSRTYHRDRLAATAILTRGSAALGRPVSPECLAQLLEACAVDDAPRGPSSRVIPSDATKPKVAVTDPLSEKR